MTIRTRDLRAANTSSTPLETLTGGRLAKAHRVLEQHRQADSSLGNARNVIARVGLHGATSFQIPSTDPYAFPQRYPLRSVYRTVARIPPVTLLPGHFIRVSCLADPAGMTNKLVDDDVVFYEADIAFGEIAVTVEWGGPDTFTTTSKRVLVTSSEEFAGEATEAGASWANLRHEVFDLIYPETVTTSSTNLRKWSEGVTAEVAIRYKGGVRVGDLVVQQVPYKYARNVGTDAASTYSSTLVTDAAGAMVKTYPVAFPIEERSATDPTYGALLLDSVVDRQHHGLGPALCHQTSWSESSAPVDATEIPAFTTTSTSFVDMTRTSVTAWSAGNPGLSLSSGSLCLQYKSGSQGRELRGKTGVVPVRCWAYASRDGVTDAVIRFQSADCSVVDVVVDSSTPGWFSTTGFLRCGAHPADPSVLQVFGRVGNIGATLSSSAVCVQYLDL